MPRQYLETCNCGSGQPAFAESDARGIFIAYCCDACRTKRLAGYRDDVLTDPNYEADEAIEPEDY